MAIPHDLRPAAHNDVESFHGTQRHSVSVISAVLLRFSQSQLVVLCCRWEGFRLAMVLLARSHASLVICSDNPAGVRSLWKLADALDDDLRVDLFESDARAVRSHRS